MKSRKSTELPSTNPSRWGIAEPDDAYLVAFWDGEDGVQDVRVYVFDGFDVLSTPISGFVYDAEGGYSINRKCNKLIEAIALNVIDPFSLRDKKITHTEVEKLLDRDDLEVIFGSCKG